MVKSSMINMVQNDGRLRHRDAHKPLKSSMNVGVTTDDT